VFIAQKRRFAEAAMSVVALQDDPMSRVRAEMEIITSDGRCAGRVSACSTDRIFMSKSEQPILREWIRRVDRDVFISKKWNELTR
jgi:hypothetical protein